MTGRPNDFPRSVKFAAILRATRDGVIHCESCDAPITKLRVHHVIAAGLNGPPTLANALVLGPCCYTDEDAAANRQVKRATRIAAKHFGYEPRPPKARIQGRAFAPKPEKPSPARRPEKSLPRRAMYE